MRKPVARNPTLANQDTLVSSKHTSLRDRAMARLMPEIIKMLQLKKGVKLLNHYVAQNPIPILQAIKIRDAKAAVDKEWEKLENLRGK